MQFEVHETRHPEAACAERSREGRKENPVVRAPHSTWQINFTYYVLAAKESLLFAQLLRLSVFRERIGSVVDGNLCCVLQTLLLPSPTVGGSSRGYLESSPGSALELGRRLFSCPYCPPNTTFSNSSNFKRHLRLHSGEKPFKCIYCSYSASRGEHLRMHMARRHGSVLNTASHNEKENSLSRQHLSE